MPRIRTITARLVLLLFLVLSSVFFLTKYQDITSISSVFALDEIEQLEKEIQDLENMKKLSEDATKPLEKEVTTLESRIAGARAGIAKAKKDAAALATDIEKRETELAVYYALLSERVRSQYKQLRVVSPLLVVFSSDDATDLTKGLTYHSSLREKNQNLINTVGEDITKL